MSRVLGLLTGNRRAAFAAATAVVVAAVGTAAATVGGSPAIAAPKVINAWQVGGNGDGLNRYVIQLAATHSTAAAAPAASSAQPDDSGTTAGTSQLDVAALAAAQQKFGTGGSLVAGPDGEPRYVVGNNAVPVGVGDTTASPVATPASNGIATLTAQPGVVSAQLLHDGSALIATKLDAAEVAALPGVQHVATSETASVDAAAAPPNDPFFSYEWQLKNTGSAYGQSATAGDDVDALDGWPTSEGAGTVIADIDTGMANVTDLAGALWTNPNEACGTTDTDHDGYAGDCHGWNFYANNADITNGGDNEHGTLVAGVIAATANNGVGVAGEAPEAKVMPLVVGGGESIDIDLAITAIYYAVNHGATVINCSFGGGMDPTTLAQFTQAIDFAGAHHVMVVAAAGNSTQNTDVTPSYPAAIIDPNLITVGATDANDALASFSNYGATTVDMFAPGSLLATTGQTNDYVIASGTSFSAPLVAAAIAMMESADPTATLAQIRARLLSTTTPVARLQGKGATAGVLDVGAALGAGPGVLHYHFTGLGTTETGSPTNATLAISGTAPAGQYTLSLRLATHYQGAAYAVAGVPVTINGTTATTDDSGTITVPVTGSFDSGVTLTPTVTLPDGQYAWISQVSANGIAVGHPAVATFIVGSPSANSAPATSPTPSTAEAPTPTPSSSGRAGAGSSSSASSSPTGAAPTSRPTGSSGSGSSGSGGAGNGGSGSGGSTSSPSVSAPPRGGSGPSSSSTPSAGGNAAKGGAGSGGGSSQGPSASATSPASAPSTGGSSTPSTGGSGGGNGKTYPGTDPFQITGIAPANVSSAGGTLVTITGHKLPAHISVLVGGSPASLYAGAASSSSVSFFAPAAAPGAVDVAVYDTVTNQGTVLSGALTFTSAPTTSPAQPSPSPMATHTSAPGASGNSGGSSTGSGGAGSSSTSSATASATSGPVGGAPSPSTSTSPSPSRSATPTSSPSQPPAPTTPSSSAAPWTPTVITGPGGLRLVGGDPSLAELNGLWSTASCAAAGCDAVPM